MPNYLKMPKKQQILALLELGWTYRRIQAETGVRRETISGYDRQRQGNAAKTFPGSDASDPGDSGAPVVGDGSNAAKTFAGSDPNAAKTFAGSSPPARFAAARYHDAIVEKRALGLTAQRIWQDLTEEFGYGHSYESVKRYLRTVAPRARAVGVFESDPGQEGQIDFFRGAPTFDASMGQWKRPWVFRLTLCHSRHGYEEAVWDQQLETFLRLHERAFRDLGGVPTVVRHDNLKSGVSRACFYDPVPRQNRVRAKIVDVRPAAGHSTGDACRHLDGRWSPVSPVRAERPPPRDPCPAPPTLRPRSFRSTLSSI